MVCVRLATLVQGTAQGCIKFLPPSGGKFIKYVGEEYKVVKRGRECHVCGKEYNVEKRERGSNIVFPIILRLLGRISIGEEGKRTDILW